jgi:hypothetical protein
VWLEQPLELRRADLDPVPPVPEKCRLAGVRDDDRAVDDRDTGMHPADRLLW